jgi:hypothetical protein
MPQRWKVHEPLQPHFATSTVLHLIPVFRRDEYLRVLTDSLIYCVEHRGFHIDVCDHIHENPVRAGYVQDPSQWTYSSACLYCEGRQPVIRVDPIDW